MGVIAALLAVGIVVYKKMHGGCCNPEDATNVGPLAPATTGDDVPNASDKDFV
jgi:hypothetical protein